MIRAIHDNDLREFFPSRNCVESPSQIIDMFAELIRGGFKTGNLTRRVSFKVAHLLA